MQDLFDKLDARKEELAALSPLKREDAQRLWKKFRLEWNYNSNHIEGNTLTYQETELVLLFDQAPGGHTVREIEEMKAHDVAIALVQAWAADANRDISQADIRSLNETLLVRPFWKEAVTPDGQAVRRLIKVGEYKEHPNSVRLANGEMFHYAEPHEVESKMGDLIAWYRKDANAVHPAIVAAKLHYDFVRIHPFDDGNGRVSRLLMNYHLLRHGFPPVIIKSEGKKAYLAALNRADVGDFEAFATYIAEQLLWSLDLSIRAAKGESVEEEGDWEKQVELLKRAAEGKKASLSVAFTQWLTHNFPLILKEAENRFGVFQKFFKTTSFSVFTRLANGQVKEYDMQIPAWIDQASAIFDQKQKLTIVLQYFFEGFQYPVSEVKVPNQLVTIEVLFERSEITILIPVSSQKSVVSVHDELTLANLQPIRIKAESFFEMIKKALG